MTYQLGIVGLGTMGQNLALNFADNNYNILGYDTAPDKINAVKALDSNGFDATNDITDFVKALKKPRAILIMVPAGNPVDQVIDALIPLVEEGDLLIDGGNSHFPDTDRRYNKLHQHGIGFMGMGISGGEDGARHGPSMMPGGTPEAYQKVQPILEAASAHIDNYPCVDYLGKGAAGHYVKMVHNGIEYGMMQLLAECYHFFKTGLGYSNDELGELFNRWNNGRLNSFLIEITANIFHQPDGDNADDALIDKILDSAKQKGTGKWTSQSALDLGIPIPVIDMAVTQRSLSAFKKFREEASHALPAIPIQPPSAHEDWETHWEHALYFAFVTAYTQGFQLIKAASDEYGYEINPERVARIWRGGCIIRAGLLEDILTSFNHSHELSNLLLSPEFTKPIMEAMGHTQKILSVGIQAGIALPCLQTAWAYVESMRNARLPTNLIQAQRDYFGAHTYNRIDKEGTFHTNWNKYYN